MQFKTRHTRFVEWINKHKQAAFSWFLAVVVLQSLPAVWSIVKIPVDPKNIFLLGLTRARFALLGIIAALDLLAVILLFSKNLRKKTAAAFTSSKNAQQVAQSVAFILTVFFWIALWLPKYRLGDFWEEYERLRPFLLWLGGAGGQFFLLLRIFSLENSARYKEKHKPVSTSAIVITVFATLCMAGFFLFLKNNVNFSSGIIEPAPAPVTPLQLFLLWLLVTLLLWAGGKKALFSKPLSILITAVFLYLLCAALFLSVRLPCKGDFVGIYPPNYTCYPDSFDAVYQVGSLYTYYGEGIYNQWFTDKPIYMFFLTACQWIAGTRLEGYMTVQVLFLSLLPPVIFLLARRISNYYAALLAAGITIITQYNAILLYSKLGGVNILIAATEIFTALLLACAAWLLFKWFRKPERPLYIFSAGIVLGLATLSRFNAALVIPFIGMAILFHHRKNKWPVLRSPVFFVLGLTIALAPWFLINPMVTPGWENPYAEKIRTIFMERSAYQGGDEIPGNIPVTTAGSSITPSEFNTGSYGAAEMETAAPQPQSGQEQRFTTQVLLHYANNITSAFFALPVNTIFDSSDIITNQSFWDRDFQAIWRKPLTSINLLLFCSSICLFVWGAYRCWREHGFGGLSPLIIFLGYHFGNSLALTSGGRYLLPVAWIVILYFITGLIDLTKKVLQNLGISFDRSEHQPDRESKPSNLATFLHKTGFQAAAILLLALPALALPFLSMLPDQLPEEHTPETEEMLYSSLDGKISKSILDNFVKDDNSTIVEGVLFYPQYYSESRYSFARDKNVFESLILGKDHVYISYMWHQKPEYFSDGSRVLIAGCTAIDRIVWNMDRKVIQSYAIIQLDNEGSIYIDPEVSWTCQ
jgi:4-amino-4-deoxy-L-arabinose transferase-like glycosyltransferase